MNGDVTVCMKTSQESSHQKHEKRLEWTIKEKTLYAMYLIVFLNPFVGKEHSLMQY